MKLQYQLQGTFHRLQLNNTDLMPVSLVDLIREVQAIATQNYRRSPQLLRQSFGLDFLPQPILINLLQQAQRVVSDDIQKVEPQRSRYQDSPRYQAQMKNAVHLVESTPTTYRYQFTCSEATLDLTPDNPQIPVWIGSDAEQPGTYTITLESPHYPGLSDEFAYKIWQQAIAEWQNLSANQQIYIAVRSLDPTLFSLTTPQTPQLQIWIESQDLSLDLRAAITFLRLGGGDTSTLPETVKLQVHQYQLLNNSAVNNFKLPCQLSPNSSLSATQTLDIGRRNRATLKKLISEARQFLFISSYIIEDEELTELICQKAKTLPQGIWILTDLRNEVIDRIDVQVSNNISLRSDYQRSDMRKKACLRMLLNANIPIRSGAFHLKIYISEQCAYLGSCNLTRGSLDFNLEAGIVAQNNSVHTQLINLFCRFWQHRSRDEVIPISNLDGFRLRSITRSFQADESYPNLLNPSQYKRDLIKQLTNFREQVQIYSRSFQPSPEIEQLLCLLDTRIFVDSQVFTSHSKLKVKTIDSLHAKVTLLGNKVAYIGGINFNFGSNTFSLTDLMYKTTDSEEIIQIRQQLASNNL